MTSVDWVISEGWGLQLINQIINPLQCESCRKRGAGTWRRRTWGCGRDRPAPKPKSWMTRRTKPSGTTGTASPTNSGRLVSDSHSHDRGSSGRVRVSSQLSRRLRSGSQRRPSSRSGRTGPGSSARSIISRAARAGSSGLATEHSERSRSCHDISLLGL